MLQDVLLRVHLPVANLRSQTYDGAGNVAGEYNGCQANIKRVQPLCIYTHCGAHVSHLVTSKSIEKSVTMRDALDCVQELGKLSNHSGKFRELKLAFRRNNAIPYLTETNLPNKMADPCACGHNSIKQLRHSVNCA
ncbi:hypothetical protein HOLleu_40927 [Holothuria leucospilota]|uniref:Uncharacterized protein n=1 Tax=Holothuria leucospilota TaxID=206669 RepID=A0A9Q0YE53_HOLLE|nr:hypothetical protein HOLleu_40927 [Holothuria leucospilota]